MESTRLKKVSRLLQKELSIIFQQEARNLFEGAMISVTEVKLSPDISYARVYLSFFLVKDNQKLLALVKEHTPIIRRELGNKVRNQLRIIPELQFFIDDSLERAMRIEELLKK